MATAPTAETPDPSLAPTAKVLSGVDALVRFKASLDRELADVRALELNARATGLTVEQRRAEVGRLLAQFDEFMAVEPAAPLLQASSRCSQTALFTAVAISIAVEDEPIFPGLARAATVWGYSWSNTTAIASTCSPRRADSGSADRTTRTRLPRPTRRAHNASAPSRSARPRSSSMKTGTAAGTFTASQCTESSRPAETRSSTGRS